VRHESAFESHEINSAPGNVVTYSFDPANQNVLTATIHDGRGEAAMVQTIGGNQKGVFGLRHRNAQRMTARMVAATADFTEHAEIFYPLHPTMAASAISI
jgi:hypothetical protein